MMALESYVYRAECAGDSRLDGDIPARAVAAWCDGPFVLVDVRYHSKGYQALYEIDTRNGSLVLAQD